MEIQVGRLLVSSGCRAEKDERAIYRLSFNYVDIPRKAKMYRLLLSDHPILLRPIYTM